MSKVLVSFEDELLDRIDREVERVGGSRSAFLADAAAERLERESDERRLRIASAVRQMRELAESNPTPGDTTSFIRKMRDERWG